MNSCRIDEIFDYLFRESIELQGEMGIMRVLGAFKRRKERRRGKSGFASCESGKKNGFAFFSVKKKIWIRTFASFSCQLHYERINSNTKFSKLIFRFEIKSSYLNSL